MEELRTLGFFILFSMEFEDGSDKDRNFKSCWKKTDVENYIKAFMSESLQICI